MMNSPGSDKPAIITTAPQAKRSEILMWLKEDLSDHCHMPHYTADTTATWTQGDMTHQKRRKGRMLPSVTFPNSSREAQRFRWGTFTRIDLQEMTLGCIPVRLPCSSFFPGHLAASPAARGAAVPLPGRSQSHTQSIRQHTSTGSNPRCISLDDFPLPDTESCQAYHRDVCSAGVLCPRLTWEEPLLTVRKKAQLPGCPLQRMQCTH